MSLKDRWNRACAETIGGPLFWRIAVDHLSIDRALRPLIETHARGVVLDAGAGRLAWRDLLLTRCERYIATDYESSHPDLGFVGDIQGRIPLRDASVDTIFCCSVMEHTPEPWLILPEFRRVLKKNGRILLSVPFLYYLHGAPHDYFRFTKHGVERLARAANLEIVEMQVTGGWAHAAGQAFSVIWAALFWNRHAPWLTTAPVRVAFGAARALDRLDRGGLFAQTINVVLAPADR
jgi:SAM-dependent methyltransferase